MTEQQLTTLVANFKELIAAYHSDLAPSEICVALDLLKAQYWKEAKS